jgi:hypothetical protein
MRDTRKSGSPWQFLAQALVKLRQCLRASFQVAFNALRCVSDHSRQLASSGEPVDGGANAESLDMPLQQNGPGLSGASCQVLCPSCGVFHKLQ